MKQINKFGKIILLKMPEKHSTPVCCKNIKEIQNAEHFMLVENWNVTIWHLSQ